MAITPTDFEKIWSTNASTPEYTFSDADYLEGWDFVGNLPPTRAQWNAIQKRTDEKMKYVFDNFGAPLVAPTVADMTMQNRVYVYTGSEAGYTAGDWYYYDEGTSAWVDGGAYNSNTVQIDSTLTVQGDGADAQVTGYNITGLTNEVNALHSVAISGYMASKMTTSTFGLIVETDGIRVKINGTAGGSTSSNRCIYIDSNPPVIYGTTTNASALSYAVTHSLMKGHTYKLHFELIDGTVSNGAGTTIYKAGDSFAGVGTFTCNLRSYDTDNSQQGNSILTSTTTEYTPTEDVTAGGLYIGVRGGWICTNAVVRAYIEDTTISASIVATDTSLTRSGIPADAHATGYAIDELKENVIEVSVPYFVLDDWEVGTITSGGVNTSNAGVIRTIGYKELDEGSLITFTGVKQGVGETYPRVCYPAFYDKDKVFIDRPRNIAQQDFVVAPNGTHYVRIAYGFYSESGITVADYGLENLFADFSVDIKPPVQRALPIRKHIDNTVDVNTLLVSAFYSFASNSIPLNIPANVTAGLLRVDARQLDGDDIKTYVSQTLIDSSGQLFYRYRNSGSWTTWKTGSGETVEEKFPDTSKDARILATSIIRAERPFTVMYGTLPKSSTEYYDVGEVLYGVPYSGVWRDGQDVYRNLTLETFYSATANPASVLYTKDYRSVGIDNGIEWYGGVCSTFVGRLLNIGVFYSSVKIRSLYRQYALDKETIYKVGAGDFYNNELDSSHSMMISQVYTDAKGEVISVDVSEQGVNGVRTRNFTIQEMKDRVGSFILMSNPTVNPFLFDDGSYCEDVIFEYGNKTYRTVDQVTEGMWFYIPSGGSVYYRVDGGDWDTIALSGVTTDVVNEVTVYDLQSIFDGVGVYEITTDTDNEKYCAIKIIDTGIITVNSGVATFSNYDGCTPLYCYYVDIRPASPDSNTAFDPPVGYVCHYGNQAKVIENDTVDMSEFINTSYSGYKLWVEFDTDGFGYKQAFSQNIFFE